MSKITGNENQRSQPNECGAANAPSEADDDQRIARAQIELLLVLAKLAGKRLREQPASGIIADERKASQDRT